MFRLYIKEHWSRFLILSLTFSVLLQAVHVSGTFRHSSATERLASNQEHLTKQHATLNSSWVEHPDDKIIELESLCIAVTSGVHQLTLSVNGDTLLDMRTTSKNITMNTPDYTPWDLSSGIYVMVLHQVSGRLMMKKILMTGEFGSSLELPSVLMSLTVGRILILASKNDAALNLSDKSRDLLIKLGVTLAYDLKFRNAFAWIGTVGGRAWAEVNILDEHPKKVHHWSSPVTLEVIVPKIDEDLSCFNAEDEQESLRSIFCDKYDGYGTLCSCENPAPIRYPTLELKESVITDIPLVIIASNRPTYLYRCLLSILRQAGGHPERILVIVDGRHQEVRDLLQLLQIPYIEHEAMGVSKSARVSDHYRFSINEAFHHFPMAPKIILLEEDLLAAPDFFSYFNQTAWLLDEDPSLWCISAWNDLSGLHVAHDSRALRRVETLPGLGWMLTRNTAQELLDNWPPRNKEHDWDLWARGPEMLSGRECVVPDVGRTFHFGLTGVHSPGLLHAAFFSAKPVSGLPYVQLSNVHRMKLAEYEEDLYSILEKEPLYLNSSLHPCHLHFLPRNSTGGRPVLIFIDMRTYIDYLSWKVFARCLGLWDLDTRASHRGLYRFFFYDTEVFVIGYPYSDYSYLKPPWLKVMVIKNIADVKKYDFMAPSNRLRFRRPQLEKFVPFFDIVQPKFPAFDLT